MIQAIGLTSNARKHLPPAVDDVNLEACPGRVTALLGAPGSGKTTALRLMLELDQGRGVTCFRGRPLRRIPHPAREVGVLLGEVPGHPGRTVRGQLRMLCAAAGVPGRRADEVLEAVGLDGLRAERLGTLSRGMDRRLGMACALLADPHTLVLDAPVEGLPSREGRWLHGVLRDHADNGGTVLFATSDPREAARAADQVVTLDRGKVVADQAVAEFARTRLRPRVAVRSPYAARLGLLLAKEARAARRSVEVVREDGNRLSVYGSNCADVGETAFRHGILVHQLADEIGDMGPPPATMAASGVGEAVTAGRGGGGELPAEGARPRLSRTFTPGGGDCDDPSAADGAVEVAGPAARRAVEPEAAPPPPTGADDPRPGVAQPPAAPSAMARSPEQRPADTAPRGADPAVAPHGALPEGGPRAAAQAAAGPGGMPTAAVELPAQGRPPEPKEPTDASTPLRPGRVRLPPPITARPVPGPLRPLHYELCRVTGIGTGYLVAACVLVVSAFLCALLARTGQTPQPRLLAAWPRELPLPPAALGAALLGALSFGEEFRHPAPTADRGTVPRRISLLAAKLLVAAGTAAALALFTVGCDAALLHLVYGPELTKVPHDWPLLSASWLALAVGCACAGVLAAGVFKTTTAGLAAVLAVPVVVAPLVRTAFGGPAVRSAAGLPGRLRDLALVGWPFGVAESLAATARLVVQPLGGALVLSLVLLLSAHVLIALRSRAR